METPFPGMDPYLEDPAMWPDVHHELIALMREQLQSQLTSEYRAVITPYANFESLEIAPNRRVIPDVAMLKHSPVSMGMRSAVVFEAAPLLTTAPMKVEVEYGRIEIRTVHNQVLITAIELLSPANKRPGQLGATAYEQKRQDIFLSTAHLLEIDLLRMGIRPEVTRPLPDAPYFIFLSCAQQRPQMQVWPPIPTRTD